MISLSVKVTNLEQFPDQAVMREAIRKSIRRSGQLILLNAQANVGRLMRTRTGTLRRGFQLREGRESAKRFVVTVRNTTFYAHMLEGGTQPHKLPGPLTRNERWTLARQKVLRFEAGGKTIFARAVKHPGLRPRWWFASAVNEALPELQAIFEQEIGAAIAKSTGGLT